MPARGSRSISRPRFHVSRQAAIGFMLLNTVVWGAALPLVKPGLEVTTAFLFLFERFLLAGILTLPLMIWYFYKQPKLRRSIPIIVALEILGTTVALALLYSGLERTSSLEASLINLHYNWWNTFFARKRRKNGVDRSYFSNSGNTSLGNRTHLPGSLAANRIFILWKCSSVLAKHRGRCLLLDGQALVRQASQIVRSELEFLGGSDQLWDHELVGARQLLGNHE
jgi:hypothetical protein